jgi:TRAP-type mannitol/chloroaromatic compound transport system substrate-binding protein
MVQVVEVIRELINVIDRFEKSETEKDERIEKYLRKIEQCLQKIVDELKNGGTPTWSGLQTHAQDLSENIGDVIGRDAANHISQQLAEVLKRPPENTDLMPLKDLISSIEACADKISIRKQPKSSTSGSISRNAFILGTFGAGVGAAYFVNRGISSVNWTMVSVFGKNTKKLILPTVPETIRKRILDATDGLFNINIDENKTLDTDEILEEVHAGKIQCGYSGIFYGKPKYKSLFFGCAIPFGLSPQEQTAWLLYRTDRDKKDPEADLTFMQEIGQKLGLSSKKSPEAEFTFMQRTYRKLGLNVIPFPAGGTGRQMGGWFNKEIKSITDFDGLTMRIPGLGADVLRSFGVKLDSDLAGGAIAIDEIAEALKDGIIDAAEWNGPHDDMELGLHLAAEYYYYPGWWEPSSTLDIQVNLDAWNNLPRTYQEIFKAVCQETYIETIAKYDQKNSEKFQEILNLKDKQGRPKVKVIRFDENKVLKPAKMRTEKLLKEYASKDKTGTFEEVYKEWKQFRDRIRRWSNLNDINHI